MKHCCHFLKSLVTSHKPFNISFGLMVFVVVVFPLTGFCQFAPPAGQQGSDAIHADSSILINWANSVTLQRGLQQINDASYGNATYGTDADATAKADGLVVSLGDGGQAILQFDFPLFNGPGPDFVVFENAFDDQFLELALVAVSSDGQNFFTFPAQSLTQTGEQLASFGTLDATKIHQLAGKFRAPYGVPFDLDSLPDDDLLDKMAVTHIKITDVVGSLDTEWRTLDFEGRPINDPWPTPFPSSGFDLDAVGVIHDASNLYLNSISYTAIAVWPNPFRSGFNVEAEIGSMIRIFDLQGRSMCQQKLIDTQAYIDASTWNPGMYVVEVDVKKQKQYRKVIKR